MSKLHPLSLQCAFGVVSIGTTTSKDYELSVMNNVALSRVGGMDHRSTSALHHLSSLVVVSGSDAAQNLTLTFKNNIANATSLVGWKGSSV